MPNPIAPKNHILLTMNEIDEMSNREFFCRIAGVDPLSIQDPMTAENIIDILNRMEVRIGSRVLGNREFINSLNEKDSNITAVFDQNVNYLKMGILTGTVSFHTTDGKTVFIDPEEGLEEDQHDFVERFNKNAMSTYYEFIIGQPVRDETGLSNMIDEAVNASRENKSAQPAMGSEPVEPEPVEPELTEPEPEPETAAEEPASARRVFESTHSRWMEAGIDIFDLDAAKALNENADVAKKRKIQFIADLTGEALDEKSTYEDFKTALDSIIINGRSAYDYFDLKNKPKNIETITESLVPQLTDIIDNSFSIEPHKMDFIFIKKPGKDAVPLKLSSPDVYVPQSLEDVRDRLLSVKEVQDYVNNSYLLRFPDTGGSEEYSKENEKSEAFQTKKIQNRFNYGYYFRFEDREDIDIERDATYATRLLAKSNAQIMADRDKYLAPVIAACKAQPDYDKQVLDAFNNAVVWDTPDDRNRYPKFTDEYNIRLREKLLSIDKEDREKKLVQAENKVLLNYAREFPIHIPTPEDETKSEPVECLLILQDEIAERAKTILARNENVESIDKKVENILNKNVKNYSIYQDSKLKATFNDKYNKQADTYARKLNNESVNRRDERDLQYHANVMPPKFSLRLDEIGDPESLMKRIRDRSADIDNIMIDGKSVKTRLEEIASNITHKNGLNNLDEQDFKIISRSGAFRKEIFEKFDNMIHPDMYPYRYNRYNEPIIPVITLKTDVGEIAPTITSGNELEPLPKVEPMSGFMRMFSKPNTIAANEKAVKEYEESVKRAEIRHNDNMSREAITETIRINTKFSSGKALTPEERMFAASRSIIYPNPDVRPASLTALQQRTGTAPRNLSLTQPTNTNENSNSMNGPQNGMSAGN